MIKLLCLSALLSWPSTRAQAAGYELIEINKPFGAGEAVPGEPGTALEVLYQDESFAVLRSQFRRPAKLAPFITPGDTFAMRPIGKIFIPTGQYAPQAINYRSSKMAPTTAIIVRAPPWIIHKPGDPAKPLPVANLWRLQDFLQKHPLPRDANFQLTRVFKGQYMSVSVLQVRGRLPRWIEKQHELLFGHGFGKIRFEVAGKSFPLKAKPISFLRIRAGTPYSISNEDVRSGPISLLMISLPPASNDRPVVR